MYCRVFVYAMLFLLLNISLPAAARKGNRAPGRNSPTLQEIPEQTGENAEIPQNPGKMRKNPKNTA